MSTTCAQRPSASAWPRRGCCRLPAWPMTPPAPAGPRRARLRAALPRRGLQARYAAPGRTRNCTRRWQRRPQTVTGRACSPVQPLARPAALCRSAGRSSGAQTNEVLNAAILALQLQRPGQASTDAASTERRPRTPLCWPVPAACRDRTLRRIRTPTRAGTAARAETRWGRPRSAWRAASASCRRTCARCARRGAAAAPPWTPAPRARSLTTWPQRTTLLSTLATLRSTLARHPSPDLPAPPPVGRWRTMWRRPARCRQLAGLLQTALACVAALGGRARSRQGPRGRSPAAAAPAPRLSAADGRAGGSGLAEARPRRPPRRRALARQRRHRAARR